MALTATDLFNDATTREIGGVGPDQVNLIASDLIGVQQMLSAADPQINNLSDLHTHIIINQLNEEIASVENVNSPTGTPVLGTDLGQYVGRSINDIHRDIIDIAQGDAGVQALFNPTPLPALNTPAAPFHDSADQTTFITQWIQDSNHLGQMATTIENNGFTGDIAGLVQQIQTYATNSNTFDRDQGGLWSARFWNEFRTDGTSGTAATALIDGLQTHNAGEVNAAVEQLAANSADVGSNNIMANGGSYASVVAAAQATAVTPTGGNAAADPAAAPPAATPPAATPPAAAAAAGLTATDLFNDATTREIGGVGPDQVNLIASDLIGVQQMLSAADPQINNLSDLHTHIIINQLNEEIASVENVNSPTGTPVLGTDLGQYVGRSINDIHRDIIDIAQGDAGVQALFNPTPLPALNTPAAPFHDSADQTTFITQWIQDSNHLGQMATTIENNGFTGDIAGLVQQIQTYATNSNTFDRDQGGLWSARFWNEFRTDGTSGTAATALIDGLQTHSAGEVNAAVEQLAANSADVGSNNIMANGGSYASVVAAAQATAVTPTGGNAAADPAAAPPAATPPAATPPAAAAAAGLTATDLFNDATTREIGGVGPDQVNLIASDLIGVQQMLSAADPQINNLSDLHTHIIINQLNEEIASVENVNSPTGTPVLGTDLGQYVGRSINDIHRDIIDIAQGDAGVQALFNPTPLPALNTPAAPFHDSADQTTFITQWIQDSNHLGQMATTIENNGFTGDIAGLVQQIQTYATNSNTFDRDQGGLWSARFWNEFRTDGTSGTAATALIDGLQTHNAGEVNAAVEQLAANSADVGSNNIMANGGSYASVVAAAQATAVTPTGGNAAADPAAAPPAATPAAATPPAAAAAAGLTATDLFNDATTREIGGVGPDQVNLIASDLIGVQQMLSAADPQINNLSDLHTHIIINQLNEEIASVENVNSPTGTPVLGTDLGQYVGRSINDIHRDIIDIAQGDAGVQALFNPTPLPALNTPAAPFHDSADQTTFITQWIQDSNHLGQMATTIENNGFTGDIAGLVQQIQTYATNSNTFDRDQGGLWSARFWNEFRTDGTSGTAANALIDGLQTHNAGEVNAAVEQLAANSADVGSNNIMANGGSYASVVAAAQAAPPVVTPDPPATTPTPPTDPTPPAAVAPAFSDLGLTFNDASRALEGGLWQNVVEEGGQGHGSIGRYATDLTNVQTGLQAEIVAGQFTGDTLTHVNTILADITTALSAATASVNGGGTFGSVAAAETALHTSHLDILSIVNNDPTLSTLATQNGAAGFLAAPAAFPGGTTAANAPHANLAEIGAIFNDLANISLGGINADNSAQATADTNAVITDMQALMAANPLLFGGLTGVHADTVVRQLQLENTYIAQAGVSPDAGRASNDNLLDIIDIVQGDTNLANMANQGGFSGFTPFGDALNPTPKYLDNDAQTSFWANFIAQSNALGQQAIAAVGAHDAAAAATLVADMQAFQTTVTNFDAAQGGIFEARFDNELLGNTSTLGAEVAAMVKGLQTGNAALVAAAAEEMHANAADVGGNNLPTTGGTYNPDGLTVADVLSTPVAATAPVAPAAQGEAPTPQNAASTPASSAPAPTVTTADAGATPAGPSAADCHHSQVSEIAHHFHHMWG